ncbi:ABC transporter substrate-binding protein [Marinivivus vitaminiproducens]|uniref:ABC transporter substrate-binding protein n=1 Tax=Marinivivus vitaminiproducens TaxID=3035935 RepID=UPI0027A930C1|nr:ABC transporter substrate-binding protein [Geminicoccaceae bacterium SCSIO 64248]
MRVMRNGLSAAAMLACAGAPALAADPIKVGVVATLSGPSAVLGQQVRDGFQLAIRQMGGQLGGVPTEVIVVDDEQKSDVAVGRVQTLLERDQVDFVVGPVFSNVAQAIAKPITESETFMISANAGPSTLAGADCSPFFFSSAYQNDQVHAVLGKYAQDQGYPDVVLMTPNYQAGKDAMAGFKRYYQGEVVDEIFTQLGQLDFSAELARIAAYQPAALYTFMPGGMGVNLVKQFSQAGLTGTIPFLSAFTVDETTLPAEQDAALGLYGGANWAPTMNNPQSKTFVDAYEQAYGSVPGLYAMQGFDAALLIDSVVDAVGGDLEDKAAMRTAFLAADFISLRGDFAFSKNGFPIQDFYLVQAAKRADGKYQTEIVSKVFEDYADDYVGACTID